MRFSKPLIVLHVLTHKQNYYFSCKKILVPKQETSHKFIKNILTLKSQDLVLRFILLNSKTSRHVYKQIQMCFVFFNLNLNGQGKWLCFVASGYIGSSIINLKKLNSLCLISNMNVRITKTY